MVAKSGWISAALLPGLRSFEVFAVSVVQKRVTIYVLMYIKARLLARFDRLLFRERNPGPQEFLSFRTIWPDRFHDLCVRDTTIQIGCYGYDAPQHFALPSRSFPAFWAILARHLKCSIQFMLIRATRHSLGVGSNRGKFRSLPEDICSP